MTTPLLVRFGRVLRRFREAAGYSQESLAAKVKVHRNYIGLVERGQANISLTNIERIAKVLDVSVSELLREAERDH